ncbi:MAG: hypothetical protein WC070_03495 [Candidatus Magasanikbacteria bacterium]
MNKKIKIILLVLSLFIILALLWYFWWIKRDSVDAEKQEEQKQEILKVIEDRIATQVRENDDADPFGEDGLARILLIGLDSRAGQTFGHCDVIQMLEIDKNKSNVQITAVPRGTYSSLPPGKAVTSTDYYVSNACGLAGLDYGIKQIEKILGKKADYLVVVGFSETLGILRSFDLPTTETLQWLRQRQGYRIGEPQRARNHSTFIKQMMTKYIPEKNSKFDLPFHYLIYKIIKTDLSFEESEKIIGVLSEMELSKNSDKISLAMRPSYDVEDIPYNSENVEEYVKKMIDPVKNYLKGSSYTGVTLEEADAKVLATYNERKTEKEFVNWAFENNLWMQVEDEEARETLHLEILQDYLKSISEVKKKEDILTDYILEMKYLGLEDWASKGEKILEEEIVK